MAQPEKSVRGLQPQNWLEVQENLPHVQQQGHWALKVRKFFLETSVGCMLKLLGSGFREVVCMSFDHALIVEEWWNFKRNAVWRSERPWHHPFKSWDCPFLDLPHGSDPGRILIDIAHTFHIHGVGVDFAASSVVLCCRKGLFGAGTLDSCICRAYYSFMEYCVAFKKTTACKQWMTHKDLDMANNNDYPTSIKGKGFDTALVCSWISWRARREKQGFCSFCSMSGSVNLRPPDSMP